MQQDEKGSLSSRLILLLGLAAAYLIVRALALFPLLFPLWTAPFSFSDKEALLIRAAACAVLFIILAGAERIFARAAFTYLATGERRGISYGAALKRTLNRIWRVLPLALPCAMLTGLLVYLFWFDDFTSFKLLKQIAALAGASERAYDVGAAMVVLPMLILLAASAILWHRGYPLDYVTDKKTARSIIGSHGFLKNSLINFLIALVPILAWAAVLAPVLIGRLRLNEGLFSLVASFNKAIKEPLNNETWMLLILIFVLLYLPLLGVRKARAAAFCAKKAAMK